MEKLRECPFCGGEMHMIYRSASKMYMIYHKEGGNKCDIVGPFKIHVSRAKTLKEAGNCWNRRVYDEPQRCY